MLFFGGILVGSTRTPPEKPLYCCRKGCCSQFRTGDSRMRFLKDSRMLIHYQICSSLQNKPPKKKQLPAIATPFFILLLRKCGRRCRPWLGMIWTSTFLVCCKNWTLLCPTVHSLSYLKFLGQVYGGMPILRVLGISRRWGPLVQNLYKTQLPIAINQIPLVGQPTV